MTRSMSNSTSSQYTQRLEAAGVRISMDGKGRALDNIFTERLWRSVKYEEVYLYDYACPRDVRHGITRYLARYNGQRPHQALAYQTPVSVYFAPPPMTPGASGGPHDLPTATS